MGFEPMASAKRCSTLPTELWRPIYWVQTNYAMYFRSLHHLPQQIGDVVKRLLGSLSNDDDDGYENVTWKAKSRSSNFIALIPCLARAGLLFCQSNLWFFCFVLFACLFFFLPFSLTSRSSMLKLPDDKDRLRYRQRLSRFPAKMTLVHARAILCRPRSRLRI